MRLLITALMLLATSLLPRAARAAEDAPTKRARAAFAAGMKDYNLGDCREAIFAFEKGYLEKPDPAFLYNTGG